MPAFSNRFRLLALLPVFAFVAGCTEMKTRAVADVAVANEAVDDAIHAGGTEHAPLEILNARAKLTQAQVALKDRNYTKADLLAQQALADARLAAGKANTAKTQATLDALQKDLRILQEQIERSGRPNLPRI